MAKAKSGSGVFKVTAKGKVENEEVTESIVIRSTNQAVAKAHAQRIFDVMRKRAVQSGGEDPGLTVDAVEHVGEDASPPGGFRPPGAKPIDLNKYAAGEGAETGGEQQQQ